MPYAQAFSVQKAEARKAIEPADTRPEPQLELAAATGGFTRATSLSGRTHQ